MLALLVTSMQCRCHSLRSLSSLKHIISSHLTVTWWMLL